MPTGIYARRIAWEKTKKLNIISDLDAARLAMAIDCEGSIVNRATSHSKRPRWFGRETRILIYNTDKQLLNWVSELTGLGKIRKHNNGKGAFLSQKITWVWDCSYLSAYQIIKRIYPWIILKKEKAHQSINWNSDYEEFQ